MSSAALLQLASPALPIGAFSYSSGLETAIEREWVRDRASAGEWLDGVLRDTVLTWDVPLWSELFSAWQHGREADIARLNQEAIAARETHELRAEHTQMGFALRRWCIDVLDLTPAQTALLNTLDPISILTAHALAVHAEGLSAEEGALAYAFGFLENQVTALAKALPLGQTDSQRLLRASARELPQRVKHALQLPRGFWSSTSPMLAIASMQHETQYTRLFRS
jgi:urease accessory protein